LKHRIAHIINPFIAPASSDLSYAQPITFESIKTAKKNAEDNISIELLVACYPEDLSIVPEFFKTTSVLERSVLDQHHFQKKIRLPVLKDILQRAIDTSEAEFILYTNVDIGLYPDFYLHLKKWIDEGHDALIINRKRIPPIYDSPNQLPKIYQQEGKAHPGFDCFLFKRELFDKMHLENICIGVPFIEITFSQNLFHLAKNFKLVKTGDYTFHIGMEIFKNRAPEEYVKYNRQEFRKAIKKLDPVLKVQNLPFYHLLLPFRIIKWGLHPCIPIKLALKLQWRKWFVKTKSK
jgi:hypothetical protein